jgi:hypothetical protein
LGAARIAGSDIRLWSRRLEGKAVDADEVSMKESREKVV